HQLMIVDHRTSAGGAEAVLTSYSPETVAQEIGLPGGADAIRRIAHDLWENRGRSLVVAGSIATRTPDALALQVAANWLNSILENEGATVDGTALYSAPVPSAAAMAKLMNEMNSGMVDALVIARTNPGFSLDGFADALKKVPFV